MRKSLVCLFAIVALYGAANYVCGFVVGSRRV